MARHWVFLCFSNSDDLVSKGPGFCTDCRGGGTALEPICRREPKRAHCPPSCRREALKKGTEKAPALSPVVVDFEKQSQKAPPLPPVVVNFEKTVGSSAPRGAIGAALAAATPESHV